MAEENLNLNAQPTPRHQLNEGDKKIYDLANQLVAENSEHWRQALTKLIKHSRDNDKNQEQLMNVINIFSHNLMAQIYRMATEALSTTSSPLTREEAQRAILTGFNICNERNEAIYEREQSIKKAG